MTASLEPCALHADGGALPDALFAPGKAEGQAGIYWRHLQAAPVSVCEAVEIRDATWLVAQVAVWRGSPGCVHAELLLCNSTGQLRPRPIATVTGYGVQLADAAPVPTLGVLTVTTTADQDGTVQTVAELIPVGAWVGQSGDLLILDGARWEQVGDATRQTSPAGSTLPVVHLRRVRDGVAG